eukprot:14505817-Alexandrium_andersonii.AAC.1
MSMTPGSRDPSAEGSAPPQGRRAAGSWGHRRRRCPHCQGPASPHPLGWCDGVGAAARRRTARAFSLCR